MSDARFFYLLHFIAGVGVMIVDGSRDGLVFLAGISIAVAIIKWLK